MELNTNDLIEKFLLNESENLQKHIKTDQNIGFGRNNGKTNITKPIKIKCGKLFSNETILGLGQL